MKCERGLKKKDMNRYIALLRGINVSGVKKIPKVEQLQMLSNLKFKNPQIYLHTGNWVFESSLSVEVITKKIQEAILKEYGWEVPIIVTTALELESIFNANPFPEATKEKSYFTLLTRVPSSEAINKLQGYSFPDETYHIASRCVYFYPAKGAGRAKMSTNFFENKLRVAATSRNYRTIAKLVTMLTA